MRRNFLFGKQSPSDGLDRSYQVSSSETVASSPSSSSEQGFHDHQPSPVSTSPLETKDKEVDSGPRGLNVVYTPNNGHKADIVFVHGLGGTSRWSWSKNKNPKLFWPLTFLPLEPDICLARILTFGYNASIHKTGGLSVSVLDFAKDLLFELKYAKDLHGEELNMGEVPLIFVVHSMGGLIVKEAYMQGQHDPEYEGIIKSICAIIFLATPHRGTNLAQTLNRILESTMLSNAKQYISDLGKNSPSLQKLNEQFRHVAPKMDIVSFYETRPTSLGLKSAKVMILEKDSSVLGYPGEISKALDADHHDVCKYGSPEDHNYVTVRNVLKSLMSKLNATGRRRSSAYRHSADLKALFAISELPDADFIFFRDQWTQGTNDWILQHEAFLKWRNAPESTHSGLWLNGGAATGKSIMSSFIINHLVEDGACSQYFFIRFGDKKKRTLSLLLRSIAYQLAQAVPSFQQNVLELAEEAIDFETLDPRIVWDRLFRSILFKTDLKRPLFWIIDGLDEADNPPAIIKMLSDIPGDMQIRILFTGRRTAEIITAFEKVVDSFQFGTIRIEGHMADIRQHINQELRVHGSDEFQKRIARQIEESSQNNFLWVRLAVEKVNKCYTHTDVENALREFPVGMEALYYRMASSIANISSSGDKALATRLLQCASCSLRVLKVAEVLQAVGEEAAGMLDLEQIIVNLCAGFVVIDNSGHVSMMHLTSRDYLFSRTEDGRPFRIDREVAHSEMFLSCMRCLMSPGHRARIARNETVDFLDYAATSWSSHLALACTNDPRMTETLKRFLAGKWVLSWIHVLATFGQLRSLIRASANLLIFVEKVKQQKQETPQVGGEQGKLDQNLLESWAVDLLRIVPKFGNILRRNPEAIFKSVPPFCPKGSSIYQIFGKPEIKRLSVTGLLTETWDDSLARMSLPQTRGAFASHVQAAGSQIALLAAPGSIFLYDSSDFEESPTSPIEQDDWIYKIQLNSKATLLATCGYRTTRVWNVSTGTCKLNVPSVNLGSRPLVIMFSNDNTTLLVGTDDQCVRSLDLTTARPEWQFVADLSEPEIEGHLKNSASHMSLSPDGSLIAVGYRSHPLSAWEIDGPIHVGHCRRKDESAVIRELRELVCHPHTFEFLGLNLEGVVFKWAPYEDDIEEMQTPATRLALSRDGSLFATADRHGIIDVFITATFTHICRLGAQDTIFGLAFSPDMRRLYDARGYYANAWEPSALVEFAERSGKDDNSSTAEQKVGNGSMVATHGRVDSITALAWSPRGRLYASGTGYGTVHLHDVQKGKLATLYMSRARFTIEKILWSADGRYLCFSDASKQILVFSTPSASGAFSEQFMEKTADIKMRSVSKGPILQIMLHPTSNQLLVQLASSVCIVSVESSSVIQSLELEESELKWIVHPQNSSLIIGLSASGVYVYDWNLVEQQKLSIALPVNREQELDPKSVAADQLQLERVLTTADAKFLLLQTSSLQQPQNKRVYTLSTASLARNSAAGIGAQQSGNQTVQLVPLAPDISSNIALTLTILSRNRLLFLSKTFTVCSVQLILGSGYPAPPLTLSSQGTMHSQQSNMNKTGASEIFSLPGDWISRDSLALSSIWPAERAFLCPRNGETAVVKCAALI